MNILYLSCHSILEFDEVKLFTELGHNVFSVGGAYQNPNSPQDIKRPGFKGFYDDHLQQVAIQCSKENLHPELIAWADLIYIMHKPEWVIQNWKNIKHKRVVWRSIGQSISDIEIQLSVPRSQGLKIVRYSPKEHNIPGFIGEDAMIRFYKDPDEFGPYTGERQEVITMAQSMKIREKFCGFEIFEQATRNFPRKLYGPGNEDSGIEGGLLRYKALRDAYRRSRVYFYTGTYPASYTLNFIEAFMTGIPVVAIGRQLADLKIWPLNTYEVDELIEHGENGFVANNIDDLRELVRIMLEVPEEASFLGRNGRKTAIKLFGKKAIGAQWTAFFHSL